MSIEIPEKCPKCGEAVRNTKKDWVQFECWSERYRDESGLNPDRQSGQCLLNERHLLTKRVAELEEAGDLMATWAPRDRVWVWLKAKGQP